MRSPSAFPFCVFALISAATAWAHNPGLSSLHIESHEGHIDFTLQFAPPDLDGDGRASLAELSSGAELLKRLAPHWLRLKTPSDVISINFSSVEIQAREEMLVARASINQVPAGLWQLELLQLGNLVSGHREFVSITQDNRVLIEALLSSKEPSLEIPWSRETTISAPGEAENLGNKTDPLPTSALPRKFFDFVKLGIEHILTGYDHLLYLAGLIVACRKFRGILAIITSFTIAHSITLALATIGAVDITPKIVEPLIAASIAYVGIENLLLRGREPRGRWAIAFGFGLVHGFGFAGLLKEIGVGANGSSVVLPLFSFNLGVEIGQLTVVGLALPLLIWARRRPRFEGVGLPASSALVALFGMYWFVERVWF